MVPPRSAKNHNIVGAGRARDILAVRLRFVAPSSRAWPAPTALNLMAMTRSMGMMASRFGKLFLTKS